MRRQIFNLLDFIKGNPIKKSIKDIESKLNELTFEELQSRNQSRLMFLLNRVTTETNYYKKYRDCRTLSEFPVVNKNIIKDNFVDINLPLSKSKGKLVETSGSTGTPFSIYQSPEKRFRNTADTIYFARRSGFEIGNKLLYLRYWAAYYKKPKILAWLQNIEQLDVEDLSDDFLADFLKNLQRNKAPKSWLGYPSGFDKIIKYLERSNSDAIKANVNSIIAMSEPLPELTREKMSYYFNCPTVSRYSNVENGIIAQQDPHKSYFTINWASYIIELLDLDNDKPVKEGELGRIVITDLYNEATPMIRYDTGDVGIMKTFKDQLPVFERIEGRKADILTNDKGEIVNPFVLYNSLGEYPELKQVQLIQNGTEYTFKININGSFEREKEFLEYYKPYLGSGAKIRVQYVDEIPTLKSGKRKIIINETGTKKVS